jgi:hypothetical protein
MQRPVGCKWPAQHSAQWITWANPRIECGMNRLMTMAALAMAMACGGPPPTQEQIDDGTMRVDRAVNAMQSSRDALQLMGLVPTMPCGVPKLDWLRELLPVLHVQLGCAEVTDAHAEQTETLSLDFGAGCRVGNRTVSGRAEFVYADQDGIGLSLDLTQIRVDGAAIPVRAGYEVCKDDEHYFAQVELPELTLDVSVKKHDEGFLFFKSTNLTIDADESLKLPGGTEHITAESLVYEVGEPMPTEGTLTVQTPDGHRIEARFLGDNRAELTIDDRAPVTLSL